MRKAFVLLITLPWLLTYSMMQHAGQKAVPQNNVVISDAKHKDIWKAIDSLERKGLTQSAIELLNAYYDQVSYESNSDEKIKTVIHLIKFISMKEEKGLVLAIKRLEKETRATEAPTRNIYYSMLAELYWTFYNSNAWRFAQRSNISGQKSENIETWSVDQILEHSMSLHDKALTNESLLWETPIEGYEEILEEGNNGRTFHPTVYDFIAHRALQFFADSRSRIHRPIEEFQLENELDFSTPLHFSKITYQSPDEHSAQFRSITIYSKLTTLHLAANDTNSLIHWTIERLKYVYAESYHAKKDSLYMSALQQLALSYKAHPGSAEAWYALALFHHQNNGAEELGTSSVKAHRLCKNTIAEYPESYGGKWCKKLLSEIEAKQMLLQSEYILIPDRPALIHLQHRNLHKIHFRIVPFNEKWETTGARLGSQDFLKDHLNMQPVKSWQTTVINENDFSTHAVEKEIPPLPLGRYVILASEKEDFSRGGNAISCSEVWVSNLSMIHRRKKDGHLDFHVMNRQDGIPLEGVEVSIYRVGYDYKSRTNKQTILRTEKTKKNGYFFISPDERGTNFRIKLKKGLDYLDIATNYYSYPITERRFNQNERRTLFFTDRAIYRPGQIINFKGIRYASPDRDPHAALNEDVLVTFFDVNHQEVANLKLKSNKYGSFSGSFTIPLGILKGRMLISDGYGQQYVQVEEYKRPKFEVQFEPVKEMYKLGSSVALQGSAISYHGIPLDAANVRYRIKRTMNFPYWCRYFYPWLPSPETKEIAHGTIQTDEDGIFRIEFKAVSDAMPNEYAFFNYEVEATVSDVTGETHSANTTVHIGQKALNLQIDMPDIIDLQNMPTVYIRATNLSGQAQKTKGNLKVEKLKHPERVIKKRLWSTPDQFDYQKEEFVKKFPNSPYKDENNAYTWPIASLVTNASFSSDEALGAAIFDNEMLEVGYYLFTATTTDVFGETVTSKKIVRIAALDMKAVPANEALFVWPVKTKGEPGESALFVIGSRVNSHVLMQVLHRDSSVVKMWIKLNKGVQKIEIPIKEKYRGNFGVQFSSVLHNRRYNENFIIQVPYSNKELKLKFKTFRDELIPGSSEEWSIAIEGPDDNPAIAEMVPTMYDASLEAFLPHTWRYQVRRNYISRNTWLDNGFFRMANYNWFQKDWNERVQVPRRSFDKLNWFGFPFYSSYRNYEYATKAMSGANMTMEIQEESADMAADGMDDVKVNAARTAQAPAQIQGDQSLNEAHQIKARSDFNETAFFYPHLYSKENGEINISFKIPEALTKWKMMGLAHTPDLKFGYLETNVVTKKELMIEANTPRFMREGDKITISAKINNLLDTLVLARAGIQFRNAQSGNELMDVKAKTVEVQIDASSNSEVSWEFTVPDSISLLEYTCWASTASHEDAERKIIPVLSNRMLVTESLPFHIRGNEHIRKSFDKLKESGASSTLQHHALTLEITANPAWYVVQALPYLNESTYPSAEMIFGKFYANSLASYIANANPAIQQVFEKWQTYEPDALLSNLEKNQELKNIVLKETPWVLQAKNESEQKRNIALLFQVNSMTQQLRYSFDKLLELQNPNGGWSWFPGMPDNAGVTYRIMSGMGKLDKLNALTVKQNPLYIQMVQSAINYMDRRMQERYDWIKTHRKNLEDRHISSREILYLYARSNYLDIPLAEKHRTAYAYFLQQCGKYWLSNNKYVQAMSAVVLHRNKEHKKANEIMASLKENALHDDEMGMYWKAVNGYWWYQAPIERQSMLIEAFDEVVDDSLSVEEMQIWLIKQKQTQHWGNARATVEACYALLNRGRNWLSNKGVVEVKFGKQTVLDTRENLKSESGTGYVKMNWEGSKISREMGDIQVSKNDEGIAWGSVYWQYFEELNNITPHETPLSLKKELFVEKIGNDGLRLVPLDNNTVKIGDKVKVRIELRVDRDMEFVHLKDMRSAGLEPVNVISQYKFQDGLGYYESTSDVATNYFFDYIRKGVYVFEYQLIATISGEFSNGISQIQCLYAPEFSSHSQGQNLRIIR